MTQTDAVRSHKTVKRQTSLHNGDANHPASVYLARMVEKILRWFIRGLRMAQYYLAALHREELAHTGTGDETVVQINLDLDRSAE